MEREHLNEWDAAAIEKECGAEYRLYLARRKAQYQAYFLAHPDLADPAHTYLAKDFSSALPATTEDTHEKWLPKTKRHRHHLSGNSSQTLTLALLGNASANEPSMGWWWAQAYATLHGGPPPTFAFEHALDKNILKETGGATSVDFYAEDDFLVVVCECKWTEQGIGACGCREGKHPPGSGQAAGTCRSAIYDNDEYWDAAEWFGLEKHEHGQPRVSSASPTKPSATSLRPAKSRTVASTAPSSCSTTLRTRTSPGTEHGPVGFRYWRRL